MAAARHPPHGRNAAWPTLAFSRTSLRRFLIIFRDIRRGSLASTTGAAYAAEKRAALTLWGDHLMALVERQ